MDTPRHIVPRLGLTGGIGSGKSEALAACERLGAAVLSSDAVVHELLGTDAVRDMLRGRWGDRVVRDGEVDRAAVAEVFSRKGVVYLKADWTSRSAEIASILGSFGRSGVPLYVVYPSRPAHTATPEPRVLPQILTEGTIIEAIEKETL